MQVRSVGGVTVNGPWTARPAGPTSGFSVPSDAGQAKAATAAAPAASLDGMLAVQEGERGPARDREARRRGQAALGALAALQRALLGGEEDPAALQELAALASAPSAEDPGLAMTLRAIGLRARVELARRGL